MLTRIPPVARHVDAATKGEAIVNDDDLLVMGSASRMGSIEAGVDLVVPHPSDQGEDRRATKQGSDGADIPAQEVDFQFGPALDQPEDEVAQLKRPFQPARASKADPGVKVPADEHNPALCRQHRQAAGLEIVVGIDNQ